MPIAREAAHLAKAVTERVRWQITPSAMGSRMLMYPSNARLRKALLASGNLEIVPPREVIGIGSAELAAASRVVAAYRAAAADERSGDVEGLWDRLIGSSYGDLATSLASEDVEGVARVLEAMFGTQTTTGLSMGAEVSYLKSRGGRDFFVDWWLDGLLSLGAYFGLVGETMETGKARTATAAEIDAVYDAIGGRLGTVLCFPEICNAWGIAYRGRLMPRSAWRHIHAAHFMATRTAELVSPSIVEIGGGFGGAAYWMTRLRPTARYTIYDFPIVNVIAGYFLIRSGIDTTIVLNGEPPVRAGRSITVLPHWRAFDEPDGDADIAFNQDSLPEMPHSVAVRYVELFDRIVRVGLYSENHEGAELWDSNRADSAQLRLPELDQRLQRLHLEYRSRAWMRRGYFETFYTPRSREP